MIQTDRLTHWHTVICTSDQQTDWWIDTFGGLTGLDRDRKTDRCQRTERQSDRQGDRYALLIKKGHVAQVEIYRQTDRQIG